MTGRGRDFVITDLKTVLRLVYFSRFMYEMLQMPDCHKLKFFVNYRDTENLKLAVRPFILSVTAHDWRLGSFELFEGTTKENVVFAVEVILVDLMHCLWKAVHDQNLS